MTRENRTIKYKEAIELSRMHRFKDAFDAYVQVFFPYNIKTTEFFAFYRYQLSQYLCMKNNFLLALSEGDMISDLILSEYKRIIDDIKSSDIPISQNGRITILESVSIVFPCQNDTKFFN